MSIIYCLHMDDVAGAGNAKLVANDLLQRYGYLAFRPNDISRSAQRLDSDGGILAASLHLAPMLQLKERLETRLPSLRDRCWLTFTQARLSRSNADMLLVANSNPGRDHFEVSASGVEELYYRDWADVGPDTDPDEEEHQEELRRLEDRLAEEEGSEENDEWEHYGTSDDEWIEPDDAGDGPAQVAASDDELPIGEVAKEWNDFVYQELDDPTPAVRVSPLPER